MGAVYKKELRQYFNSMVGFVFLAFFLAIVGIYTWAYNIGGGYGNFEATLGSIVFLFVLLIPILTMRIVAEENHQRTDQLLYTSPVSVTKIILGKYLAVLTLFGIGVLLIGTYPLIISSYGTDVQLSTAYSALIGFFLLGAAYIAIGMFISSFTESQVIAAVVSFLVMLLTFLMSNLTSILPSDNLSQVIMLSVIWLVVCLIQHNMMKNAVVSVILAVVGEGALWIIYGIKASLYTSLVSNILECTAIASRFDNFTMGILQFHVIVYYVSIVFLFIFLTIQNIKRKRYV